MRRHSRPGLRRRLAQTRGQIDRHGAAERMAVDETLAGVGLQLRQTIPGDARILVYGLLGGQVAVALAKTAIVHRVHRPRSLPGMVFRITLTPVAMGQSN